MAGHGGVPGHGVAAVVLNVTVTGNLGHGYVSAYPYVPKNHPTGISSLNYVNGVPVGEPGHGRPQR